LRKKIVIGLLATVFVGLCIVYKNYNPTQYSFFPKCPFFVLTDVKCPGCGSQRGFHHLLNLNVASAAKENLLMVLFLPYLVVGFWVEYVADKSKQAVYKLRTKLFGLRATYIVLAIVLVFWGLRIVFGF
jgi:hypothetical protein